MKVEIQNCQTWLSRYIQRLVDAKILSTEALDVIEGAPKN
jgi:hypothetical protein